ncbi:unnamed protein product [Urochloa decumbens]|uniref:BED-type domain-containing protein n=1 Tax=Urochloa decumbens TaxID=240449 RepID=A0ABC9H194_9POAL
MATHHDAAATARLINDAIEDVCRRGRCEEEKREEHCPLNSHAVPQVNARLADLDPWCLPPRFLVRIEPSKSARTEIKQDRNNRQSRQTHSGYWKDVGSTAIRSESDKPDMYFNWPTYSGLKTTLKFHLKDDTKTDWFMHEYRLFDTHKSGGPAWLLKEDLAICKVFQQKRTDLDLSKEVLRCRRQKNLLWLEKMRSLRTNQAQEDDDMMRWTELNLMKLYLLTGDKEFHLYKEDPGRLSNKGDLEGSESRPGSVERPTASAAPNNGKSKVWENFTKIYTKDPDVVYAACHRCDKLLSASSKNGTSHLKNHSKKCSGHNPSTAEDQEMLRQLRAILDKQGTTDSMEVNANLDPWDLQSTPCYITSSLSWETHQGCWKEVNKELTAIRETHQQGYLNEIKELTAIGIDQLPVRPTYLGLRRTLEFHHHNGTKMNWIMLEYNQVDEDKPPHLFLQGDMVFRKVFHYDKAKVTEAFREMDRWLNDDNGEQQEVPDCFSSDVQGDQSRPGKRKRTGAPDGSSDVWFHFTKVYTADPDKVYAVCHFCDRGFGGHSKNGTSHLQRHKKTCSSKHHKREEEVWPFELIFEILKVPTTPLVLTMNHRLIPNMNLFSMLWHNQDSHLLCFFQEQESGACTEAGNKEMA